jgi:Domain of unknown function (DUF3883)
VSNVEFARLFSMSAFEGLRSLRRYQIFHSDLALSEVASLVAHVESDGATYDFEAALALAEIVSVAKAEDATAFYQSCIEAAVLRFQPIWVRIVTFGRKKLVQKLSRDEAQCFREAGLLIDPPSGEVIAWWDRLAAAARVAADQVRLERARIAERLSLEHEIKRLKALGIDRIPVWISIEDNTAGYDIQSYDLGPREPTNRLIEVKSTIASPIRFRLTRHEWDQACGYGASYHFHIWDLKAEPPRLHQRTVEDVRSHIPSDNNRGRWENAEIPIIQN